VGNVHLTLKTLVFVFAVCRIQSVALVVCERLCPAICNLFHRWLWWSSGLWCCVPCYACIPPLPLPFTHFLYFLSFHLFIIFILSLLNCILFVLL